MEKFTIFIIMNIFQKSDPSQDDTINILMIGNSYCYYFLDELYGVLEAAGVKAVSDGDRAEKNRQKRMQAKRNRTAAKLAKKAAEHDGLPAADVKIQNQKENTP